VSGVGSLVEDTVGARPAGTAGIRNGKRGRSLLTPGGAGVISAQLAEGYGATADPALPPSVLSASRDVRIATSTLQRN
jgi:hypothetical protein